MKTQTGRFFVCVLLALMLACTCGMPQSSKPTTPPEPPPVQPPTEVPQTVDIQAKDVYPPPFAHFEPPQVSLPPVYGGKDYTLPVKLEQVKGLENIELSQEAKQLLSQNGFVVTRPVPGEFREFYQVYERTRYEDIDVFITTDSVLHVYHLIFDKMLRDLETNFFIPYLESFTAAMLKTCQEQYTQLKNTPLEEQALRNLAYFSVAARLLELSIQPPAEAAKLAEEELALINTHSGVAVSPIWARSDQAQDKQLIEDYSQYIPRGHYTRSEALQRYFRAMMWYGRMTFRLRDTFETQRALLLTQAIRKAQAADGTPAMQLWQNIYEPTVFLVGKADDLSYGEYGAVSDAVFGASPNLEAFGDETLMAQFYQAAKNLPPPQVNSMWVWIWEDRDEATQGFRVMGQRFTLDAYIFQQLIWRQVGTMEKPRDLPKALDVLAAMGSAEARQILREMGEDEYENYPQQMEKITQEVGSLGLDSWTQNVYWSWLYTLQAVFAPKNESYPNLMRTQAWTRKDLHTALGSYTELKHDTILYAKQVMAEMGGGGEDKVPHGFVELNPEVYARLYALAQMTRDGLQQRNLLDPAVGENLENLIDLLAFLQSASQRQLAGETLSDDDYWRIKYYGGELEALTIAAADKETDDASSRDLSDQKAALVADVATGMGRVLEEAIGQPTYIYVILPDEPLRIAIGAVYSYYEFVVSPEERMTDETWQQKVERGDTPPHPEWTSIFLSP
ncbi:MAG: DUF3160 domain-containing protein [Anaerolineae bacterium]|nr:DUF3160 domain-containing protein [Anaerolineae bacterium]